jgi:hypothetical protein
MTYDKLKVLNLPIGSGAIESAIRRVLNQRIKGPAIYWKEKSAQAIILLRSYFKAGRWNTLKRIALAPKLELSHSPQNENAPDPAGSRAVSPAPGFARSAALLQAQAIAAMHLGSSAPVDRGLRYARHDLALRKVVFALAQGIFTVTQGRPNEQY